MWSSRSLSSAPSIFLHSLLAPVSAQGSSRATWKIVSVEGRGLKFKSYKSRQQHLIAKHKFPTSFEFFRKTRPSKKQRQKIQRKQATDKENDTRTMKVDNATMDDLVTAVFKLSTLDSTPSSVCFGRRHTRGLTLVPRVVQREVGSNFASSTRKQ